jgi:hypothetical protein
MTLLESLRDILNVIANHEPTDQVGTNIIVYINKYDSCAKHMTNMCTSCSHIYNNFFYQTKMYKYLPFLLFKLGDDLIQYYETEFTIVILIQT